jgi:hypothetical protein
VGTPILAIDLQPLIIGAGFSSSGAGRVKLYGKLLSGVSYRVQMNAAVGVSALIRIAGELGPDYGSGTVIAPNGNIEVAFAANQDGNLWIDFGAAGVVISALTLEATWLPMRLPGYPEYFLEWEQAVATSTGGNVVGYLPYAWSEVISLPWGAMSQADKNSLERLFLVVSNGIGSTITYYNPLTHPAGIKVSFGTDVLSGIRETAYQQSSASLSLRATTTSAVYPCLDSPGPPPVVSGNRFIVGSIAKSFPLLVRPDTGYEVRRPQSYELDTAGNPVVYSKSRQNFRRHSVSLVFGQAGYADLKQFCFSYLHGQHRKFTWIDGDPALVSAAPANLVPLTSAKCADFSGWGVDAGASLAADLTNAWIGDRSARVTTTAPIIGAWVTNVGLPVTPGQYYSMQVALSGSLGTIIDITLKCYPSTSLKTVQVTLGGTGWQTVKIEGVKAGVGDTFCRAIARYNAASVPVKGSFNIGGVQIEQRSACSAFLLEDVFTQPNTRTVRLAAAKISVKQVSSSRFTVQIPLLEEI